MPEGHSERRSKKKGGKESLKCEQNDVNWKVFGE